MFFPSTVGPDSLTVVLPSGPKSLRREHPNFDEVREALRQDQPEYDQAWFELRLAPIAAVKTYVSDYKGPGAGTVTVTEDEVCYNGTPVHSVLTERILDMLEQGFNIKPMIAFMEKLFLNPSYQSRQELYGFLEKCNLPITENGNFVAYKRVCKDYKDIHSGTFDNSIGARPSMERWAVDDDRNQTCSAGLHVCSWDYLPHFSSADDNRIVMVEVNPADVVSVPVDYHNAKMRVCTYLVTQDVTDAANKGPLAFPAVINGGLDEDWDSAWEDDDDYEEDVTDEACEEYAEEEATKLENELIDEYGLPVLVAGSIADAFKQALIENDCN